MFWSSWSGPFTSHNSVWKVFLAWGGAGRSHLSPRSQLTRLSAPCLHSTPYTDSCLNTHTCSCMYSMVRNDIPTYTHKHTPAAATWPESRTGRHRWCFLGINWMSSCPQITHTYTQSPGRSKYVQQLPIWPHRSTYRILEKALKNQFIKATELQFSVPSWLWSILSSVYIGSNQGVMNQLQLAHENSSGNVSLWGRAASRGSVFVQQGHATEGPRAGATLVLLHLRVGLQVGAQVGAISKGPVTVLTSKGALTWLKNRTVSVGNSLH